jgi:lactate dehydrogenase-like 2-hydroxyacid dehydrogenase
MSASSKRRLAILDDYQRVAFKCADWTGVEPRLDVTVFDNTIQASTNTDALIKRLQPFEIICSMRERTKFPADILKRLPNLKLLTTTAMGNRSIDIKAAEDEGILVAGTRYVGAGTAEHKYVHTFHKRRPFTRRIPALVGCLFWLSLGASFTTIIIL